MNDEGSTKTPQSPPEMLPGQALVLSSPIYRLLSYTWHRGSRFREESWQGIRLIGILQVAAYFTTCSVAATLSPSSTSRTPLRI